MININTAETNNDPVVDVAEDFDDAVVGHVILNPVPSISRHSELAAVYVNTFVAASQSPFGAYVI